MRSKTLGALARGLLLGALVIPQLAFALPAQAAAAPRPPARPARFATRSARVAAGSGYHVARPARIAPRPARPPARAARGPTVYGALQSLEHSGALSAEAYGEDAATYTAALNAVKRLSGTRRAELESVVANVQQIAASGQLSASRLPAVMLTLESNVQWWSHEPLPAADQHVTVPGSHLVWEHYPGQGIEIQWLATFGEANGYYDDGHENAQLREVLEEAIPLATQRAGGIAWEYLFHFDGGAPPWTSGLSQGTALQALSRAYVRLKEPAFLTAAKQALGIFQTPPPAGVRVAQPAGTLYAEYTYAPTDRILNGFIQALNGLYEYAKLTGDPLGRQLFEAGDAEARAITPSYDTGAWSKYDQYTESNLNYHELLTEFLQSLCQRIDQGPPTPPTSTAATPPTAPTTPAPATPPASTPTGGATASAATAGGGKSSGGAPASAAAANPPPTPIPGDAIYCTTAQRFTADLHTPPAIALLTRKLPEGVRGGVQVSLSKVATVSLTVRRGGRVVWTDSALVEGGKPRLLWVTPRKPGTYSVSITAVDLAGNTATTSGTITLGAPHPPDHSR
ncbi:MAG TPA: D-glucuronyl C5-epimerase family protein [Solirubrobacteraceae bacterium]|nr:D-glucuronyl C5-epimerase family protein [Solirubrobacteraceae bacterium]